MISWQSSGIPQEKKEPNKPILEFLTNRHNEILLLLVCHSHALKLKFLQKCYLCSLGGFVL